MGKSSKIIILLTVAVIMSGIVITKEFTNETSANGIIDKKPDISTSVHVSESGEIISESERFYECVYTEDGISLTLNDGIDAIISDICEISMYEKGNIDNVISYHADTEFYVNDNFAIEIDEVKGDIYGLLGEDGNVVGDMTFDRNNNNLTIKDAYERVVALCDYDAEGTGYTVTAYDNMVCSDTTILMIAAVYAMNYHDNY